MNYADIKKTDIANGIGVRVSLFVSGCRHGCKGCFNQEAWNFNYGHYYDNSAEEYIIYLLKRPYIRGLTILGGEPLEPENREVVRNLIKKIRQILPQKDIWLYTGFIYEDLYGRYRDEVLDDILNNIDVLVDGKFEIEKLNLRLKFRGSSNQRLIDVKRSSIDQIVLYDE